MKVGSEFSDWLEIKAGVPKGSDLLLEAKESEICNFADDATIFKDGDNIESVILSLEKDLSNTLNRFRVNHMAANPGNFSSYF